MTIRDNFHNKRSRSFSKKQYFTQKSTQKNIKKNNDNVKNIQKNNNNNHNNNNNNNDNNDNININESHTTLTSPNDNVHQHSRSSFPLSSNPSNIDTNNFSTKDINH